MDHHVSHFLHNAGVKRAASAAPLERLVIHAFDFDCEPVFWPWLRGTCRTLLPGLHNAYYWFRPNQNRFLKPMKPAFMKSETYLEIQPSRRDRQIEVTTNFTCLENQPPTKITTSKNHPRNRIHTKLETNRSGFSCFDLWVLYNAGVKRPASAGPLEWLVSTKF